MRRTVFALVFVVCAIWLLNLAFSQEQSSKRSLPTSKNLSGTIPGRVGKVNSFPSTIAMSPDGRYAAFLNDGYGTQEADGRQSISVLDLNTNQIAEFPDDRFREDAHQSYFLGLAFSGDGAHLYASVGSITDPGGERPGNTGNGIAVYQFGGGKIKPERFIKIPPQKIAAGKKVAYGLRKTPAGTAISYPAGLAVLSNNGKEQLLVANNYSDNVIVLDAANGSITQTFDLSTTHLVPSAFPYRVIASRDGRRAWCSLWNGSRMAELDLTGGRIARWISLLEPKDPLLPGSHPTAMVLSGDDKLLFVALSNADAVAEISTASGQPLAYLDTRLPGQSFLGSYPDALALSADGRQLFVADAALNAVGVFDFASNVDAQSHAGRLQGLGFIPTEWYPSAMTLHDGDLLIASGKGQGTGPNNGSNRITGGRYYREHPYIATLLGGSVARVNVHDAESKLGALTQQVIENNLVHAEAGKINFAGGGNPIRHVIYVIKENRTFDQVLGDLGYGDGDRSLTMYGAEITPNEHQLALQFGVLDNFYDSGEVSGDGHQWSTAAITSEYNENTWQIAYRGKERTYDFQGTVADEFPLDYNQPDVDDPATGFLWDNVARHGISYRDYGEFVNAVWCKEDKAASPKQGTPSPLATHCDHSFIRKGEPLPGNVGQPHGSRSPYPWAIPLMHHMKPTKAALRDHFDPNYPDFEVDYPDQLRADEFLNEFQGFVNARQQGSGNELPGFVLLYLPDDHTGGTRPGKPRPEASVADNDLALGRVVDAVSHSAYWDDTAIFVVEDDAQNGFDHVDAHRSTAFVISKYSPGSSGQPFVDYRFYTTVSVVHTIEQLLGLPPMNHNDAYAPVFAPMFSGSGNQPAFNANFRNRDNGMIYRVNPERGEGARESTKMNFSRPDRVNASLLNAVLWRERMGNAPVPKPRHQVIPVSSQD
ncbi:MAG TPA: phosphoesterase [Terriglobales bacterium]|nr:phosphoesterase [Terriglobales bacterium]